jgi:hypothetical protein
MTISREERKQAIDRAIKCIAETVGDGHFRDFEFDADTPGLKDLPGTTLKELEDYGILERSPRIAVRSFQLTTTGWIEVLNRTGQPTQEC